MAIEHPLFLRHSTNALTAWNLNCSKKLARPSRARPTVGSAKWLAHAAGICGRRKMCATAIALLISMAAIVVWPAGHGFGLC